MLHDVILALATALISSVITLFLAYLYYRWHVEPLLDQRLAEIQTELEARVRTGVYAAGTELLPDFRQQVKLGFSDALADSHTAGLVEETAKVMSVGKDLGVGFVETLFGRGKPPKR